MIGVRFQMHDNYVDELPHRQKARTTSQVLRCGHTNYLHTLPRPLVVIIRQYVAISSSKWSSRQPYVFHATILRKSLWSITLYSSNNYMLYTTVCSKLCLFDSLGLICPPTYNMAEFYVTQLAVLPGKEEESVRKINELCDSFATSRYGQVLLEKLTIYSGTKDSILSQSCAYEENIDFDSNYIPKRISMWVKASFIMRCQFVARIRHIKGTFIYS